MGEAQNYDMTFQIGKMTPEEAADMIISYIETQQKK